MPSEDLGFSLSDALSRPPDIKGSVQQMYRVQRHGEPHLLCDTTDAGSVFDVGTIFKVPDSGVNRALFRHYTFTSLADPATWQQLSPVDIGRCYRDPDLAADLASHPVFDELRASGAKTHHVGLVDPVGASLVRPASSHVRSSLVLVKEFPVVRPVPAVVFRRHAWDYHTYFAASRKVLGVEHVFRLGIPGGSALLSRYRDAVADGGERAAQGFLDALRLAAPPRPWMRLDDMIYDSATKYEPEDRHLSWQEAVHLSGVAAHVFDAVIRLLALCTVFATLLFRRIGLQLWDLKWEVAVDGENPVLVDTLDPDSVRVTGTTEVDGRLCHMHFNKQAVRDYYRVIHPQWYAAIGDAKQQARQDGAAFMDVYRDGVAKGRYPDIPRYEPGFAAVQAEKYRLIVAELHGEVVGAEAEQQRQAIMGEEVELYRAHDRLDGLLALNSPGFERS